MTNVYNGYVEVWELLGLFSKNKNPENPYQGRFVRVCACVCPQNVQREKLNEKQNDFFKKAGKLKNPKNGGFLFEKNRLKWQLKEKRENGKTKKP